MRLWRLGEMDLVSNCILFHHNIVRCFYKIMQELSRMLYGYGDDRNPYTETVDFLEDVAIQFIIDRTSWYVVSRKSRQFVRSLNICNSQVGSVSQGPGD